MSYSAEEDGAGRRKLNLQPRGAAADLPSSASSAKSSKPNPFGAARPREQVIAEREGKRENEVLKEQAKKDWKPSIVLAESQREEKKAIEAELAFARSELEKEEDPVKVKSLRDEVSLKERKLDELLASFEKMAVRSAQTGGTRRSFDRRQEENPMSVPYAGAYGNRESAFTDEGYGNFRGRAREGGGGGGGRGASYGDTWGGTRGKSGQSECYTCGEVGHFSRDCPSGMGGPRGGSYGGTFGGGRGGGGGGGGGGRCYTCGQEGHFSRECPQGGGFGSRSGAYGAPPSYGAPYAGAYVGNYQPYDASGYGFAQAGGYSGNGYDTSYGSGRGGSYGGQGYRS